MTTVADGDTIVSDGTALLEAVTGQAGGAGTSRVELLDVDAGVYWFAEAIAGTALAWSSTNPPAIPEGTYTVRLSGVWATGPEITIGP